MGTRGIAVLGLTVLLAAAAPASAAQLNPDPPPAGAITGSYLMVFQACDPSAPGSTCPMSLGGTRDYLLESSDGVSWSLVPNWPGGSPPNGGYSPVACGGPCGPGSTTIIRRGDEIYLYVGLVGSSGSALLRYHIGTGSWDAPVEVPPPAGLPGGVLADGQAILDSQGRIVIVYTHFASTNEGPCPAGQPCTRLIGSATEAAGSDGQRFTWNRDIATISLSPPASGMGCDLAADPDVISNGRQFLLFFSGYGGSSTAVWSSTSLLGTYQPVSTLPADSSCTSASPPVGEIDNGPGGVPTAYFDSQASQYWLYVTTSNPSSVISRAAFSGLASPLSGASFTPVVTQSSMGFSSTTEIGNADVKANVAGICGTSICGLLSSATGAVSTKAQGATVFVDPGIKVSCPTGGLPCVADETVTTRAPATSARTRTKQVVIGRARFTIPAGAKREVTFKLSAAGARLLRNLRRLRIAVTVVSRVDHGKAITTTKTITIKAPPSKHARR